MVSLQTHRQACALWLTADRNTLKIIASSAMALQHPVTTYRRLALDPLYYCLWKSVQIAQILWYMARSSHCSKRETQKLKVIVHAFNHSTRETVAGGSLSSRPSMVYRAGPGYIEKPWLRQFSRSAPKASRATRDR